MSCCLLCISKRPIYSWIMLMRSVNFKLESKVLQRGHSVTSRGLLGEHKEPVSHCGGRYSSGLIPSSSSQCINVSLSKIPNPESPQIHPLEGMCI